MKLRWTNGYGYEDGTQVSYRYWLETENGNLEVAEDLVDQVAKEFNNTVNNVFRGYNSKKACERLLKLI